MADKKFSLAVRLVALAIKIKVWGYGLTLDTGWYSGAEFKLFGLKFFEVQDYDGHPDGWDTVYLFEVQVFKYQFIIFFDNKEAP